MHLTTLIPLLTTAISILAVCNLAADDRDSIKLTNLGSGEIALWVSQQKKGRPIESKVIKGNTGDSRITGTFTGRVGAVIAYTDDHPPTLRDGVHWTEGIDAVTMRLDDIHHIPLFVWVVNVGNSDFETIKKKALNANVRTSQIWLDERQGIEFSSFDIIDTTKKLDSGGSSVPDKFRSESFTCGRSSEIKDNVDGIGSIKDAINVYYVETLRVEDGKGRTLVGSAYGEYCGSDHLIALGANSFEDLLVHELGHAFNLEHIDHLAQDFDQTNVMHPASTTRNHLTEGQTFRAVANEGSAINSVYHTREKSAPKLKCFFTSSIACPAIQMQIWRDGGENGESGAQPKKKLAPHMKALQVYLDLDHEDVLEKADEKKARPQTFQKILSFKERLEPEFIRLLDKGLDDQVLQERERFLKEQWTRREAFLKKNPNLGLKEDDLVILRNITEQEYVKEGRDQLIQRYQEKAIGALRAINSPNANRALRTFRNKTTNKMLKDIIAHQLPPEEPTGLKVN